MQKSDSKASQERGKDIALDSRNAQPHLTADAPFIAESSYQSYRECI